MYRSPSVPLHWSVTLAIAYLNMPSISLDSLFVRCGIAAVAYYLPQDLGVGAILFFRERSKNRKISGERADGPSKDKVDSILAKFMESRGLGQDGYSVTKKSRHTIVNLK